MAKKKPAAKKRPRAAGKTRDQLDVRANVKRWVKRNTSKVGRFGTRVVYVDDLLAYLSTMDERANARRGGGGVR